MPVVPWPKDRVLFEGVQIVFGAVRPPNVSSDGDNQEAPMADPPVRRRPGLRQRPPRGKAP